MMEREELHQRMLGLEIDGTRVVEWAEPWEKDSRFDQLDGLGLLLLAADWARSERWMGDILRDVGDGNLGRYVDVLEAQACRGAYPLTDGRRR